jgi:hypothetical protein
MHTCEILLYSMFIHTRERERERTNTPEICLYTNKHLIVTSDY